jgi:hypothetical protein
MDMNRIEILKERLRKEFLKSGKEVWKNWDNLNIDFKFEITPPEKTVARIIRDARARPYALGRHLFRYPKQVTVQAGTDLFDMGDKIINKVMKHEALHLGYTHHNKDFDRIAREVGTKMSMSQIRGNGYRIEVKKGKRYEPYKTSKKIESYEEAVRLGKNLAKELKIPVRIKG